MVKTAIGQWPFTEWSLGIVWQETKPRCHAFLQAPYDLREL